MGQSACFPKKSTRDISQCRPNTRGGISHALGHQIGPMWNVPHGITSCITLPHVMRFMAGVARAPWSSPRAYKATRGVDSRKGRDWNGDCRIMAQRGRELLRATKYEKQR